MIEQLFLESTLTRLREYKSLGEKSFMQLSSEELNFRPGEPSNSIAVIIQHLHGNMLSRWTAFLTEDGEKSWRQRDAEFESKSLVKQELETLWNEGWTTFLQALEALQPADLIRTITIRTQPLVVVDAIQRQVAHYSSHVGQIIYVAKWLKGADWQSLSISKDQSLAFNEQMKKEYSVKERL